MRTHHHLDDPVLLRLRARECREQAITEMSALTATILIQVAERYEIIARSIEHGGAE